VRALVPVQVLVPVRALGPVLGPAPHQFADAGG
jgi:hypothetical protein